MSDSWAYRTGLTIGNTGSANSDKKVKFDVDTATLITAGKMQADCGDSRFTDINGRALKYFIDTSGGACNTNSTDYYVLVPTINAGNTVLYHYYGNPSAQNGTVSAQFSQATFSPTSGPTGATEENGTAPAAYWKFDEGSDNTCSGGANDTCNSGSQGSTLDGALTANGNITVSSAQILGGSPLVFEGTTDNNITTTFAITDPTVSNKTITFTNETGTVCLDTGNCGATGVSADSLDFVQFEDTLDLDANLILNQGAYTWVQNFTGDTTTGLTYNADSITTGIGELISADALTTGTAFSLTSTSTAGGASGSSKVLNIARSGANAQLAHTAYGIYSAVTNTNVTSGTNIAGYF